MFFSLFSKYKDLFTCLYRGHKKSMTHVNDPTVWVCNKCGHRFEFGKKINRIQGDIVHTFIVCPKCESYDKRRADSL